MNIEQCLTNNEPHRTSLIKNELHYSKLAESATWSRGRSSVDIMTILLIACDSTTIHDTACVYQHVFNAGLYFRVRRITLEVWILVKSVPKIGRQVGQPPQASNRREQELCFLKSATEGSTYVRPPRCFHYCSKS